MSDHKQKFQKAFYDMLKTEPYYAHFLLNCSVHFDENKVPTAGVYVKNSVIHMAFNPKFMDTLSSKELAAVIKHEVLHLTMRHLDSAKDYDNLQIANIAMDCAINQYIADLPEQAITLDKMSEQVGHALIPHETTDYYYDKFMTKAKEMAGNETLDDHGLGNEEGEDSGAEAQGAIYKAAKKAAVASAGNVPKLVEGLLDSVNGKLPWKRLLRNFVASATTNRTKATRKRINRRFDLPVPGKVKLRKLKLGVCADSSGSISDESFAAFMGEVMAMAKLGMDIVLVDADCEVQAVQKIKSPKDVRLTRSGGGGTAYQPAITECIKQGCTAIIYFGDFDTSDTPTNPGVPFLWVGVGQQDPPAKWGQVIRL